MKKPEVTVFAGPNGSGKSTLTKEYKPDYKYINADDIKVTLNCSDIEAAQLATKMREDCVKRKEDFCFETVLSTDRNILLLKRAKEEGYFIKCFFVLTIDEDINVLRVKFRHSSNGHDVPEEKIRSRYYKSIGMLKELYKICDILQIYDNSEEKHVRIFKKRKDVTYIYNNNLWSNDNIEKLIK